LITQEFSSPDDEYETAIISLEDGFDIFRATNSSILLPSRSPMEAVAIGPSSFLLKYARVPESQPIAYIIEAIEDSDGTDWVVTASFPDVVRQKGVGHVPIDENNFLIWEKSRPRHKGRLHWYSRSNNTKETSHTASVVLRTTTADTKLSEEISPQPVRLIHPVSNVEHADYPNRFEYLYYVWTHNSDNTHYSIEEWSSVDCPQIQGPSVGINRIDAEKFCTDERCYFVRMRSPDTDPNCKNQPKQMWWQVVPESNGQIGPATSTASYIRTR